MYVCVCVLKCTRLSACKYVSVCAVYLCVSFAAEFLLAVKHFVYRNCCKTAECRSQQRKMSHSTPHVTNYHNPTLILLYEKLVYKKLGLRRSKCLETFYTGPPPRPATFIFTRPHRPIYDEFCRYWTSFADLRRSGRAMSSFAVLCRASTRFARYWTSFTVQDEFGRASTSFNELWGVRLWEETFTQCHTVKSQSQLYSEEQSAGSQLKVSIKIPYLPTYRPWIRTQTQGFWLAYTQMGGGL